MSNCDTCKHKDKPWYEEPCDSCCEAHSGYKPKKGAIETVWDAINWWDSMKEDLPDEQID